MTEDVDILTEVYDAQFWDAAYDDMDHRDRLLKAAALIVKEIKKYDESSAQTNTPSPLYIVDEGGDIPEELKLMLNICGVGHTS